MGNSRFEIAELFPQPKQIWKLEGESELAGDVRLVTLDVFPLQRKAIRSILNAAGVRVVANKKKYVVTAKVDDPAAFDLSQVPQELLDTYYELDIRGSEVTIHTPRQEGMVWASQTLATLFRMHLRGRVLPNLHIRDWACLPVRGVYIDCGIGTDHLQDIDWNQLLDILSEMKMNLLCLNLCNCEPNNLFEGPSHPMVSLQVTLPHQEEIKPLRRAHWFNVAKNLWVTEEYASALRESDVFLQSLISYGAERGVSVVPCFPTFGRNALLAGLIPALSAKDSAGHPLNRGCCTSFPAARKYLEEFYSSFLEKYYPDGADYFHIHLGADTGEPTCKCKSCRGKKKDELLQDHILWLAEFLVRQRVGRVILWTDQLQATKLLGNAAFAKKLAAAGLKDRLVLQWRAETAKEVAAIQTAPAAKLGAASWLSPVGARENWSFYETRLDVLDAAMRQAEKKKAEGVVAITDYDPANIDQMVLMGACGWESYDIANRDDILQRWRSLHFGEEEAGVYAEGLSALRKAAAIPELLTCTFSQYARLTGQDTSLPPYPETALRKLEQSSRSLAQLAKANDLATAAADSFGRLLAVEGRPEQDTSIFTSLYADAVRIQALSRIFSWLLNLRQELQSGMVMKRHATSALKAKEEFADLLRIVEQKKPTGLMPATAHALSILYGFLEQLANDLRTHAARKQADQIRWNAPEE